jgi:hypothetical protein
MKKVKKIKLEDLKIQSFSTSQFLSKDETNKIIGGGESEECTIAPGHGACTYTNGCFCDSDYCSEAKYGCTGLNDCGGSGSEVTCPTHAGCQTYTTCPTDTCTQAGDICNSVGPQCA